MKLHSRLPFFVAAFVITLFVSAPSIAQEQIFIPPFLSSSSGEIKGSVTVPGLQDFIEVLGFHHEVSKKVDSNTGETQGSPQHTVVTVTKKLDKATPLLADTLVRNGVIDLMTLDFYQTDSSGGSSAAFRITLQEPKISHIRHEKVADPQSMTIEKVSFTYDKITWEEISSGALAFDSWKQTQRSLKAGLAPD